MLFKKQGYRIRRAAEIQAEISEILFREWDPIGASEEAPKDEYDSYVGGVYRLLAAGASPTQVAERLSQVERQYMGYDTSPDRLLPVARKLCALDVGLQWKRKDSA
jgi:hypothetical protein